ncbi:MAG: CHAT domain-containing protein [Deltaproteobacteria bacterium]|nr:CHAT domain-containing protein [Deltaproteobacteria bacterium]
MLDPIRAWKQPLTLSAVRPLLEIVDHPDGDVAAAGIYVLVRLPQTSTAWNSLEDIAMRVLGRLAGGWGGSARPAILDGLARVPTSRVRKELLAQDPGLSRSEHQALVLSLAAVRAPESFALLMDLLGEKDPALRRRAATALSGLELTDVDHVEAVLQAYRKEEHVPTRFWLAVSLAAAGQEQPIIETLKAPFFDWEDFGDSTEPDMPAHDVLQDRAEHIPDPIRRNIAELEIESGGYTRSNRMKTFADVLQYHEPYDWSHITEHELEPEPEPSAVEESRRLVESWIAREPTWDPIWPFGNRRAMEKVDPEIAGRAISAVFHWQYERFARERREGTELAPGLIFDATGEIVAAMLRPLHFIAVGIDLNSIFQTYCRFRTECDSRFMTDVGGVPWQMAAVAASRSPSTVIEAVRSSLVSTQPQMSILACEFIELTRRFVGYGIPTWGGGATPADEERSVAVSEPEMELDVLYRKPSLELPATAEPGAEVRGVVDLRLPSDAFEATIAVRGVPAGWTALNVDVDMIGVGIELLGDTQRGVIILRSDGSSEPHVFKARVTESSSSSATLHVVFSYQGRHCGVINGIITTEGRAEVAAPRVTGIDIEAASPLLTVTILQTTPGAHEHMWALSLRPQVHEEVVLPQRLDGSSSISGADYEAISQLLGCCPAHATDADEAFFNGLGKMLFEHTPPVFKDVYARLRSRYGDGFEIQFVSDDPGIPWELMRPTHDGKPCDFLCRSHPIGRWYGAYAGCRTQILKRSTPFHSVVPRYGNDDRLEEAEREQEHLVATFQAAKVEPATRERLLELLNGPLQVGVFHVAAHAVSDGRGPWCGHLSLENGTRLTALEVKGTGTAAQGALVVLNACESAAGRPLLGVVAGFPEAFISVGAAALLAPLWAVDDYDARTTVSAFLDQAITQRSRLGTALRDARYAGDGDSLDGLGYVLFGDVMARFRDEARDDPGC